jgi:hypothetical protein
VVGESKSGRTLHLQLLATLRVAAADLLH